MYALCQIFPPQDFFTTVIIDQLSELKINNGETLVRFLKVVQYGSFILYKRTEMNK